MIPTSPTTELDAVNAMLSVIDELPVTSLAAAEENADVELALQILRSATRAVQITGWQFNTEENVLLTRAGDNTISLPANAVKCVKAPAASGQDSVRFAIRGQKLFNRDTNTFVWTQDIRCDVTVLLAFEDLPEPVRNYLAEKSGDRFQKRALGSDTLAMFTRDDVADALVILADYELEAGNYNFLTSPDVVDGWAIR